LGCNKWIVDLAMSLEIVANIMAEFSVRNATETQDADVHIIVCGRFWADYYVLVYSCCQELMKSVGGHCSSSLLSSSKLTLPPQEQIILSFQSSFQSSSQKLHRRNSSMEVGSTCLVRSVYILPGYITLVTSNVYLFISWPWKGMPHILYGVWKSFKWSDDGVLELFCWLMLGELVTGEWLHYEVF